jgi:hypothetical protein
MKYQSQDIINNASLGFVDMPVRFFIYEFDQDAQDHVISEVNEAAFLEAEGIIEYERHSVFQNGCKQICLTKSPWA